MKLEIIKSEGLAHNSYYLSDEQEAVVIDPRRDCEIYTQLAKKECTKIKYILETHRNEDYVVGSLELQNMTEAEIGHSNALPFKYGEHNLADGDILNCWQHQNQSFLYSWAHERIIMLRCLSVWKRSGIDGFQRRHTLRGFSWKNRSLRQNSPASTS